MTEPRSSRFAVNLDPEDNDRFDRLVRRLGESLGRLPSHRGQRLPSRADLLRALLTVAEQNPRIEQLAQQQVRADAIHQTGVRAEIESVAERLAGLAPRMQGSESQEWLTDHVVPELLQLAGGADTRPIETAAELGRQGRAIARHGAQYGGYEYLRPMLDLARHLELVRDSLDPREKATCPRCLQLVRTTGAPGDASPQLEVHIAQAGDVCS